MATHEWKRVKVIVDVPVRGDYGEKDLRFAVQRAIDRQGLWPYAGDNKPSFGRALVKSYTAVMSRWRV